ncbi:MAG: Ig-like domain-containing protein [Bacteroidales bacterium]|nr:Ig-like domain-containing protein [Bacteroidales bacterium]
MINWNRLFPRLVPAVPVALILGSVLFSHSCANTTQAPTGGAKDTIPPRIVSFSPEHMSVNVPTHDTKLVFTFDEYVVLKAPSNIVLSPPQARAPKSRLRGKSVEVTFEEDLLPDMTYTLDFIDAIADNNEGNMFPGFTYVFSTGDTIDSLMITGIVQDCNTLDPVKGVTVMLYKDHADSAVMLSRPFAVTKTDDWGFFCIRNIKDTTYRLYAVKDGNSNNIYDPADNELIAFVDSLIRPVTVVNDSLPELQKLDMKDTVSCLSRKNEFELSLFREKPSKQMIMKKVRVSDRSSYLTFNAPNAHIDSMWVRGVPAGKLITQFNIQRDSLEVWVNEKSRQPDTLHMFVNYRKTDSTGRLAPFLEHVKVYYQDDDKSGGKTASKRSGRDIKHEDTICVFKVTAEPERFEQYGYQLEFTYPIVNEAFDSLVLRSVNPRQQEERMAYKVIPDSTNIRKFTVMPEGRLLTGYDYILKVPHRRFRDINGYYNDSTEVKVTLPNDEKLSTLNLILTGVGQKYIVDFLNEKRDKVLRQYIVDTDCTLAFPYLKAGKYCIRITEDLNRNSIVDSGSLLGHRQPEKVKFFKINDDFRIEIMESAEIDQSVDIAELFKD